MGGYLTKDLASGVRIIFRHSWFCFEYRTKHSQKQWKNNLLEYEPFDSHTELKNTVWVINYGRAVFHLF